MSCTCGLCKESVDAKDWEDHDLVCTNCHKVPKDTWLALPYEYEDFANERELSEMDPSVVLDQSYLLKTVLPSMKVATRMQIGARHSTPMTDEFGNKVDHYKGRIVPHLGPSAKTLGAGKGDPGKINLGDVYIIRLEHNGYVVPTNDVYNTQKLPNGIIAGIMSEDTIYRSNTRPKAAKLAKTRQQNENKILFWPDIRHMKRITYDSEGYEQTPDNFKDKAFYLHKEGGILKVQVQTKQFNGDSVGEAEINLKFVDLEPTLTRNIRRKTRGIFGALSRQLKLKGLDPNQHVAFYGKDNKGMEVRLILETSGTGEAKVKDIEVSVTKTDLEGTIRSSIESVEDFTCDPTKYNQVEGLVRALEGHATLMNANDPDQDYANRVHETKSAIDQYRIELEGGNVEKPSHDVINAINNGLQIMWDAQQIEARWFQAIDPLYYRSLKNATIDELAIEVKNTRVPPKVKFGSKGYRLGARGKAKGRLRAIQKRLRERLEDAEDAERKRIQSILNQIAEKLTATGE